MSPEKQQAYALHYANLTALSVYQKLPQQAKSYCEVEDIKQNLLVKYCLNKDAYNEKRKFKPWLHTVINNQGRDELTRAWDKAHNENEFIDPRPVIERDYKEDGGYDVVVVDVDADPQLICIKYYEEKTMEKKINILTREVKYLCTKFGYVFDDDDYLKSLAQVLNGVLNEMPDDEFKKLPYSLQLKLAKYGEALHENNITVTSTGKVRSVGVVAIIRQCVQNGTYELNEVKKILDNSNIIYGESSVRTIIWEEKKRAGIEIKRKQNGVLMRMRELFDYGRGIITVAEMLVALKKEGIRHAPSTVRSHMQNLRRSHGLTTRK